MKQDNRQREARRAKLPMVRCVGGLLACCIVGAVAVARGAVVAGLHRWRIAGKLGILPGVHGLLPMVLAWFVACIPFGGVRPSLLA